MDSVSKDIDSYIDAARTQIQSYPRELLGVFACHEELMVLTLARVSYYIAHTGILIVGDDEWILEDEDLDLLGEPEIAEAVKAFEDKIAKYLFGDERYAPTYMHQNQKNSSAIVQELLMWERRLDDAPIIMEFALGEESEKEMEDHEVRISFLNMLLDEPNKLPYFAVGLTDVEFIETCIINDIDTTLALQMKPVPVLVVV